ncbi:hypothetical protein BC940DRAFT_319239 [Gongronella butleri]|nr:hypothetical protein BC940DRAFT_319239 [Gongronella butleri]
MGILVGPLKDRDEGDLKDLVLFDQKTDSNDNNILLDVAFHAVRIIPLHTIRLYTLLPQQLYQAAPCPHAPKAHMLLYARHDASSGTHKTYACMLRDRADYASLDDLLPTPSPVSPPLLDALLHKQREQLQTIESWYDQRRRDRPERTLIYSKRRIAPKRTASTSALPQPVTRVPSSVPVSRQPSASSLSAVASPASSNVTEANKKQLKTALWSHLRQLGYDKKHEDTKIFFQTIYQSIQYVTQKTLATSPLDASVITQLIERHLEFYVTLKQDLSLE